MITVVLAILSVSCATQGPEMKTKLPERQQSSPKYDTDQELIYRITKLEKQLSKQPDNQEIQLELAALNQDLGRTEKALFYMEALDRAGYDQDPRLYGSMASIYADNGAHEKALSYLQKFRSTAPESAELYSKIDARIAQQEFIIQNMNDADVINLRPFPAPINTDNSEYLPQFTLDERTVIFTRRLHGQEDLIEGTWDGTSYTTSAISELNGPLNEGAHTISADGNYMIYTFCDKRAGLGSCDLFRTRRLDDGTWSKPANLGLL